MPVVPVEPARADDTAAPRRVPARPRSLGPDSALIRVAQLDYSPDRPGNPLAPEENT